MAPVLDPQGAQASAASEFDSLMRLLGLLNYSWTNTESLLIHLVAGLAGVDKETALVIFLTLNTTRARIDLVERLAKMDRTPHDQRDRILDLTARIARHSAVRNRFNHSIFAFDTASGHAKTIMMRIADRKDTIKVGRMDAIDSAALQDVEATIQAIGDLNLEIWQTIHAFGYPA